MKLKDKMRIQKKTFRICKTLIETHTHRNRVPKKRSTRTRAESKKQVRPPPDLEILLDLDLAVVVGVQLIQQLVYLLPGDVHVLILKGRDESQTLFC